MQLLGAYKPVNGPTLFGFAVKNTATNVKTGIFKINIPT